MVPVSLVESFDLTLIFFCKGLRLSFLFLIDLGRV